MGFLSSYSVSSLCCARYGAKNQKPVSVLANIVIDVLPVGVVFVPEYNQVDCAAMKKLECRKERTFCLWYTIFIYSFMYLCMYPTKLAEEHSLVRPFYSQ